MRDASKVEEIPDRLDIKCLTVAGRWFKEWKHWGVRGGLNNYMLYVWCDNLNVKN